MGVFHQVLLKYCHENAEMQRRKFDDVTLRHTSVLYNNTEISKVAKWLNENFLTLNVKKTKAMLLCNSQKLTRRDTDLKVYINNSLIDKVDKFKYLGLAGSSPDLE